MKTMRCSFSIRAAADGQIRRQWRQPEQNGLLPASGFTLLEILLTSLLASVVLVSLWSLSDIYLKLFATGKRKIEETQLARGLTQQIAFDISQVIQLAEEGPASDSLDSRPRSDSAPLPAGSTGQRGSNATSPAPPLPPAPGRPSFGTSSPVPQVQGTGQLVGPVSPTVPATPADSATNPRLPQSSLPRFGLFGTKQALRLIVLQTDPRTTREPTDVAEVLPQPGQERPAVASELRTIEYTFLSPHEATPGGQQRPPGLIRREWAWETWVGLQMVNQRLGDAEGSANMLPDVLEEWTEEDALTLENNKGLLHIAEVTGIEFQYYDGETWEIEWNSWERGRLPSLVEVLIQIKVNKEDYRPESDEELDDDVEEPLSLADENISSSSGTVYRRLIRLPFAETTQSPGEPDRQLPITGVARSTPQDRIGRP